MTKITFRAIARQDQATILGWLEEKHMMEFWDNSLEHKQDIINFIEKKDDRSAYFGGIFTYWIGLSDDTPFSFIMTNYQDRSRETPEPYRTFSSQSGKTCGIDFGIGNVNLLGKGLASDTLELFMNFMLQNDGDIDTFLIDPKEDNTRAIHVYEKAGFKRIKEYTQEGGYFDQTNGILMKREFKPNE